MKSTALPLISRCLLLVGFFLSAKPASALVIYIDVNNNPEERAAYQASMKKRDPSERFVSIPEQNQKDSVRLKQRTADRDEIWVKYMASGCSAQVNCNATLTPDCDKSKTALRDAELSVAKTPKVPLSAVTVEMGIYKLKLVKGENITLAISGHFGGGVFTGNLGSMSVNDIAKVFARYPDLLNHVTSIHALGCYSNTLSQVKDLWIKAFPNVKVIAGFYGRGPIGVDPLNLDFIKELVTDQGKLNNVKSQQDFENLNAILTKYHRIHAAFAIGDFYQEAKGPLFHVSDVSPQTASCVAELPVAERDYFNNVLSGDEALPENTSDSRLRSYYSALRDHATCLAEPDFESTETNVPSPDQAIRLVLYKTVVANFKALHRSDIANLDTYLQSAGVSPDLSITKLDLNDRKALLVWKKAVELALGTLADHEQSEHALEILGGFSSVLVDLRTDCVPFDWVEPGGFNRSACFHIDGACSASAN